jgi:hypothetical protein
MARAVPYLFCRYRISLEGGVISADEEWKLLTDIKGKPIAYRVRDPKRDDYNTYIMQPREKSYFGYAVYTWSVANDLKFRQRSKYDRIADEVKDEIVETDEVRHTGFIALPALGVMAVDDSISERSLGARAAVARFRAVVETLIDDSDVVIHFAGTPQDAQRALETWTLDEFSFSVRPFNPHPEKLGEIMDELMRKDNVGSLRGVALPAASQPMRDSHGGLIAEAKGLSEAGYGQYAFY